MDIPTVIISIVSSSLLSAIAPKVWDWWSDKRKIEKEEKKLLNGLLYQFTALHNSAQSLKEQFNDHSEDAKFIAGGYIDAYLDDLGATYEQVENTLRDLANVDPLTAGNLRTSHFSQTKYNLDILKRFVVFIKDRSVSNPTKNATVEIAANRKEMSGILDNFIWLAKMSMYITAQQLGKDTVVNLSLIYPVKEETLARFLEPFKS